MTDAQQPSIDLGELRIALADRLESLAEDLLGPHNRARSRRKQWRWGANGSLSLEISGSKRGAWRSHESGEGGGPIELIRHARRSSFDDAVAWGAQWAGMIQPLTDADRDRHRAQADAARLERDRRLAQREAEAVNDEHRRIAEARRIWARTAPIAGTTGERYLRHARGIPAPASGWPHCVRWMPAHSVTLKREGPNGEEIRYSLPAAGAVVLAATADDDTVRAVQRVYVTPDADNVRRSDGSKVKLTNGAPTGAAARLAGYGPLLLAEGPETGLSLWACTGRQTHVALGSLSNLRPVLGRRLVLCRDDDKPGSQADAALWRLLKNWRHSGADVVLAQPWPARCGDKSDFNDTLRQAGAAAVRAQIATALVVAAARHPGVPRIPSGDPRRRETSRACFRLLRTGIASADLLARVHAQNAGRPDPLPAEVVNEVIFWAASQPMVLGGAHV